MQYFKKKDKLHRNVVWLSQSVNATIELSIESMEKLPHITETVVVFVAFFKAVSIHS